MRSRGDQLHAGVRYLQATIESVDLGANVVHLEDGTSERYDVLVIATGAVLVPSETEGLTGPGWNRTFSRSTRSTARARSRPRWRTSRAAGSLSTSSTCPSSARWRRWSSASWPTGTSASGASATRSTLTYVTPLDGAFTKPVASGGSASCWRKGHRGRHRVQHRRASTAQRGSWSPTTGARCRSTWPWSCHSTAAPTYVGRSPGLGDELNFVPTDAHTLQSKAAPNVFVIGDAADVPASKAGSVTHFEGEVLAENIRRFLDGRAARRRATTATPTVSSRPASARRCSSTSTTTPNRCPATFPAGVGLPLLKESRLNHLGKLMFQWFYWHALLPGHATSPASHRTCRPPARHKVPAGDATERSRHDHA